MFHNIVDSVKAVANRFTAPVSGDEHTDKAAVNKVTGAADDAHDTARAKVLRLGVDMVSCSSDAAAPARSWCLSVVMLGMHTCHRVWCVCNARLVVSQAGLLRPVELCCSAQGYLQAEKAKGQAKSSWNDAKGQAQATVDDAKDSFKSNFSEDTRSKAEQSKNKAYAAADDASDSIRVRVAKVALAQCLCTQCQCCREFVHLPWLLCDIAPMQQSKGDAMPCMNSEQDFKPGSRSAQGAAADAKASMEGAAHDMKVTAEKKAEEVRALQLVVCFSNARPAVNSLGSSECRR